MGYTGPSGYRCPAMSGNMVGTLGVKQQLEHMGRRKRGGGEKCSFGSLHSRLGGGSRVSREAGGGTESAESQSHT